MEEHWRRVERGRRILWSLQLYAVFTLLAAYSAFTAPGMGAATSPPANQRLVSSTALTTDRTAPVWLFFIDDLHVDFRITGHLRDLVRGIASALIVDGDLFAMSTSGPSSVWIRPTADRTLLSGAIKKLSGNGLKLVDMLRIPQGPAEPNEMQFRASVALSAAHEMMTGLEDWHDRRKAFIYIGSGYNVDSDDARLHDQLSEVTQQASRASITIFAIDSRSLTGVSSRDASVDDVEWRNYWTKTRNTLQTMSDQTGGFAILDPQPVAETVKRIGNAMRDFGR